MSDALDRARERRVGLRVAMDHVEKALAGPAGNRTAVWTKELRDALAALSDALERHIVTTESPGGLLDDVIDVAPRLAHRVEVAKREHVRLREQVQEALAALPGDGNADVESAYERTVDLMGGIVRHRHLGADLVYEAFNVDIEGAD